MTFTFSSNIYTNWNQFRTSGVILRFIATVLFRMAKDWYTNGKAKNLCGLHVSWSFYRKKNTIAFLIEKKNTFLSTRKTNTWQSQPLTYTKDGCYVIHRVLYRCQIRSHKMSYLINRLFLKFSWLKGLRDIKVSLIPRQFRCTVLHWTLNSVG